MPVRFYGKPSTRVKKFLRFYATDSVRSDGVHIVKRFDRYFTGDIYEAAEKFSIVYESDKFFRWYEPLEQQAEGRHW